MCQALYSVLSTLDSISFYCCVYPCCMCVYVCMCVSVLSHEDGDEGQGLSSGCLLFGCFSALVLKQGLSLNLVLSI